MILDVGIPHRLPDVFQAKRKNAARRHTSRRHDKRHYGARSQRYLHSNSVKNEDTPNKF